MSLILESPIVYVKEKMDSQNMNFLLSRVTEFDGMRNKTFALKKCNTICHRIAALQKSFGFTPGEPINAKNLHRIIPAAKDISVILNKRRKSTIPMQKIQPAGQILTPQNRFLPGSSRMSGVTQSVHIPNRTNGVNSRFSTPTSTKSSIKKASASHDIVGEILKRASSTTLSSRLSTPNTAKSSIAKVSAPRNLHGRILEHDSSQTTNGTSRPTANRTSIGITYHLPAPNMKDNSPVKDKEHSSKTSDGDLTSSQESGVSVSTIDTVIMEEKENDISDLIF